MSDMMVCFSCCITQQPPRKRRRIDRSMIGNPTNFKHTGHIGSGDVVTNGSASQNLNSMQNQMQSKGGFDHISPVEVQFSLIDVQRSES